MTSTRKRDEDDTLDREIRRPRTPQEHVEMRGGEKALPKDLPRWVAYEFEKFPDLWKHKELLLLVQSTKQGNKIWDLWNDLHKRHKKVGAPAMGYPFLRPLGVLLHRAVAGLNNSKSELHQTKTQRNQAAIEISKAARTLKGLLSKREEEAEAVGYFAPWYWAMGAAELYIIDRLESSVSNHPWESPISEQYIRGFARGAGAVFKSHEIFLDGIVEATEEWKNQYQISSGVDRNPRRTHFVITIGTFFRERYHKPFNSQVADLANFFFKNVKPVADEELVRGLFKRRLKKRNERSA